MNVIINNIIAIAGSAGVITVILAWFCYRNAPLSTAIRESLNNLKEVEKCSRDAKKVIKRASTQLEKGVSAFVEAQQAARLRSVPLENLKEAGAVNVRWAALRQAGFTTLADVLAVNERRLMSIQGVGQTTAARVMQAAHALEEGVRSEPPALPSPNLTEPRSEKLAAETLHLLHAKDHLDEVANQLNGYVAKFRHRFKTIQYQASFLDWILRKDAFVKDSQFDAEAQVLLMETKELVESETVKSGRDRILFLIKESQNRSSSLHNLEEFHERYADCTALVEQFMFGQKFSGSSNTRKRKVGGIPAEVVERTERIALKTKGLSVTLRQYQVFGAKYMLAQERTILGDEMGLGKTIEALAVMTHMDATGVGSGHYLVVAPASLTRNWMNEIAERTRLSGFLVHGPEADRRREFEKWVQNGGVAVTAYSILGTLPRLANTVLIRFLVVDEAHCVKNPNAQRTSQVRQLVGAASHVCLLTGTPIENHPRDFVNLVDIIQPNLAHQLRDGLKSNEVVGAVRFKERVASAYLRRNQKDVLTELPEKIEVPSWVDMTAEDESAYRDAVFSHDFHRMRRIAILGAGNRPSPKIEQLVETIDEHKAEGRKVLVFTFFLDVLDAVRGAIDTIGTLQGSVPMAKRMAIVDKFQKLKGHGVLTCQINAGGVGLNLHAASAVILMEPQWKPSSEEQAIARAHRMGQTRSVLVHRLLTRDSVEERMLEILGRKSRFFDEYARESNVKNASPEATETKFINEVITAEIARLTDKAEAAVA